MRLTPFVKPKHLLVARPFAGKRIKHDLIMRGASKRGAVDIRAEAAASGAATSFTTPSAPRSQPHAAY